ncbi:phosphatidylinositol-specific phospholipase C domain-containing protein [Floridanema aerugineum]|uniref:1-phosphatidylinositol phosphodiesterase n=1 Tax=Floridaenema aerugineum BLCC-F46 TaxID=3153654 RepID=A0ABV4X0F8_9CYAN
MELKSTISINTNWLTKSKVALVLWNNKLWMAHQGTDSKLYLGAINPDTLKVELLEVKEDWKTNHAPALEVHDNKLYLFHVGIEQPYVWVATFDCERKWSNLKTLTKRTRIEEIPRTSAQRHEDRKRGRTEVNREVETLITPILVNCGHGEIMVFTAHSDTLDQFLIYGDNISEVIPPPIQKLFSRTAAIVSYNGQYYRVFRKDDGSLVWDCHRMVESSAINSQPVPLLRGIKMASDTDAPALAVYKDRIYLAFRTTNNSIYIVILDPKLNKFTQLMEIPNINDAQTQPSLVIDNDRVFLAYAGKNNEIRCLLISRVSARVIQSSPIVEQIKPSGVEKKEPNDRRNWMENLYPIIQNRCLNEIIIPGTHDSGCYQFHSVSIKTQSKPIYQQLEAGVRYFDLRFACLEVGYCIHHGLALSLETTLTSIIGLFKIFLETHPKEIVILHITHYQNFNKNDYEKFLSEICYSLGSFMAKRPVDSNNLPTIKEMVDANQRVIISSDYKDTPNKYKHLIWDDIESPYNEEVYMTGNPDNIVNYLSKLVEEKGREKLWVLQGVMTLDHVRTISGVLIDDLIAVSAPLNIAATIAGAEESIGGALDVSIKNYAERINPIIATNLLSNAWRGKYNIFISDFISSNLIETAIRINEHLGN